MAKTRKFIAHATDDRIKDFPQSVQDLIKKGKEQKFVNHQEISAAIHNAEDNLELLDEVYELLLDLGTSVVDQKESFKIKSGKSVDDEDDLKHELPIDSSSSSADGHTPFSDPEDSRFRTDFFEPDQNVPLPKFDIDDTFSKSIHNLILQGKTDKAVKRLNSTKPANINLRPDGTVKVLDFGLAKGYSTSDLGHDPSLTAVTVCSRPA